MRGCKGCGQPLDEFTAGCHNCDSRHGMRATLARRRGEKPPPRPRPKRRLYRPPAKFRRLVEAELAEARSRAIETLIQGGTSPGVSP